MDWSDAFRDASEPALDDEVRALAALQAGRARRAARRRVVAAVALAVPAAVAAGWLLVPSSAPDATVVLGCAPGTQVQRTGAPTATAAGVSFVVRNATAAVQVVSGGGLTALALPGETTVTLPLPPGHAVVRCGGGPDVQLDVHGDGCAASRPYDVVETGRLADLTLAHLGAAVPAGAVVDTGSGDRRVVRVRAGGELVAEAVWSALPGESDWQLQSLARCS